MKYYVIIKKNDIAACILVWTDLQEVLQITYVILAIIQTIKWHYILNIIL